MADRVVTLADGRIVSDQVNAVRAAAEDIRW
jgi:argonaute-like protein implicated in RNA metabolism and viral defense